MSPRIHRSFTLSGHVAGEGPGILLRRHLRGIAKFVRQDSAAQGAIADLVVFLQRQAGKIGKAPEQLAQIKFKVTLPR
jgi:hypothetical protein